MEVEGLFLRGGGGGVAVVVGVCAVVFVDVFGVVVGRFTVKVRNTSVVVVDMGRFLLAIFTDATMGRFVR